MSGIGAELPPHILAKRKRHQEEESQNAPTTAPGAKRSPSPDGAEKRQKVIGPAMPPAPLEERPTHPPDDDDESSDDDDFGPSLPTGGAVTQALNEDEEDGLENGDTGSTGQKLKRDDWMMMPPKQDDLAARMDPTKQRPTAFNTGKGARGPNASADDSSTWHETPEQKQKRLRDEMMGVAKSSVTIGQRSEKTTRGSKDEAAHRKIQEHNETRGPSLLDQHKQSKGIKAEDDPSKRAFDREKDMASGSRISTSQKREMLNKASGFSSKFAGGSYL